MAAYFQANRDSERYSQSYSTRSRVLGYKLIWWLFAGTRGGPTRGELVMLLEERPLNANQISRRLNLDYKTVRHHLDILVENQIVSVFGERYGLLYMLSDHMRESLSTFMDVRTRVQETRNKNHQVRR